MSSVSCVAGQSIFEIEDEATLSAILGPLSHFFMPLLGYSSLRSFVFAPFHVLEDWFSSVWPVLAFFLIFFASSPETIAEAFDDLSNIFRLFRFLVNLIPSTLLSTLMIVFSGLLIIGSGMLSFFMVILGAVPERVFTLVFWILGVPFEFLWFIPALLILRSAAKSTESQKIAGLYFRFGNFIVRFFYNLIPGIKVLFNAFIEEQTGVPVVKVTY